MAENDAVLPFDSAPQCAASLYFIVSSPHHALPSLLGNPRICSAKAADRKNAFGIIGDMRTLYSVVNLPKQLEPYRGMIEAVHDGRHRGEGLSFTLKDGYHGVDDVHAITGDTVAWCVDEFKYVEQRDCSGCAEWRRQWAT